jgi:hypothetical protein
MKIYDMQEKKEVLNEIFTDSGGSYVSRCTQMWHKLDDSIFYFSANNCEDKSKISLNEFKINSGVKTVFKEEEYFLQELKPLGVDCAYKPSKISYGIIVHNETGISKEIQEHYVGIQSKIETPNK